MTCAGRLDVSVCLTGPRRLTRPSVYADSEICTHSPLPRPGEPASCGVAILWSGSRRLLRRRPRQEEPELCPCQEKLRTP